MRETTFKAWNKVDCRMEKVTGIRFGEDSNVSEVLVEDTDEWAKGCIDRVLSADQVDLLQGTGFDDIARNKIYEGDFLRDLEHPNEKEPGEVFFHPQGYWALRYTYSDGMVDDDAPLGEYVDGGCASAFEVIGNIYENPYLMEEL